MRCVEGLVRDFLCGGYLGAICRGCGFVVIGY